MRYWIGAAVAALALMGCMTHEAPASTQALVSDISAVTLRPYKSDRGIMRASSKEEYEAAGADARFTFEQFRYPSDGLSVGAYLYRPAHPRGRLPVVIFNRGGYVRENFGPETLVQMRRLAEAGFIVVAPWLRGSNGTEGHDELGGADVDDLMNIVPVLREMPNVDLRRVYLYGESRGSIMTFEALRDGFPVRAAAVYGSWGDLDALIAPGGPQAQFAPMIWPDIAEHHSAIVERRSALHWIDRLNAPILQMHGGADGDIPILEARRIADALEGAHKAHQFHEFPSAHHTLPEVAAERDAMAIAWFRRFGG